MDSQGLDDEKKSFWGSKPVHCLIKHFLLLSHAHKKKVCINVFILNLFRHDENNASYLNCGYIFGRLCVCVCGYIYIYIYIYMHTYTVFLLFNYLLYVSQENDVIR